MTKKYILISFVFLTLLSCSRILDAAFTEEMSEFNINVYSGPENGEITILTNRTDHTGDLSDGTSGTYFRGYYIYRNAGGPYSDFSLLGIDSYANADGSGNFTGFQTLMNGKAPSVDGLQGTFVDDDCTQNGIYYYRVVVMYQKFNGTAWGAFVEKGKSSWMAAWCPKDLFGGF